jgi:hypothetical protein
MLDAFFLKISVYFQVLSNISIVDLERYASMHTFREFVELLFFIYFMYVYFPIRIVSAVFFRSWYKRFSDPDMALDTASWRFPTMIGLHRLLKLLRVDKKAHRYLKPMPFWMDFIALLIILTELVFLIMAIANEIFPSSPYF